MNYLILLLPLAILLLFASQSTWAPFQSGQVKRICSHMTANERRRTVGRGAVFGVILAGYFGVIGLVGMAVGRWVFDSHLLGIMIAQPTALILLGIAFWKLKPRIDRSHREFLASTHWSKERGIDAQEIVLRGH